MPSIKGFKINGTIYKLDYTELDNKPDKELPTVSATDNGRVLKVSSGAWGVGADTTGLPNVTSLDSGKFLTVNSSGEWVASTIQSAEGSSF